MSRKAYISVSYSKRKSVDTEINAIVQVLNDHHIQSFVFVDNHKFDPAQERQMMDQAMIDIDQSDILIAETSDKGIGIGIEAGYAKAKNKPVIYLRNSRAEHSTTVSGISDHQIIYSDTIDLKRQLKDVLKDLKENTHPKIKASMYIAFVGGILTPILETVRRCHQLSDFRYFIAWFDDYLIGGFLFFAAWKTYQSPESGRKYLIGAWGIAAGIAFCSFFLQLQNLHQPDPAPVSSSTVATVKGIMFLVCMISLIFSLQDNSLKRKS